VQVLTRAASMPENERLRLGSASNRLWQERYSLERMMDRYARVYCKLGMEL